MVAARHMLNSSAGVPLVKEPLVHVTTGSPRLSIHLQQHLLSTMVCDWMSSA